MSKPLCEQPFVGSVPAMPSGRGETRATKLPKTERGGFRSSSLGDNLPRSVPRLRRASRPVR